MSAHQGRAPDLEELAAYVDGGLDVAERRAVEERLIRDEGYYEVYLETLRFLDREPESLSPRTPSLPRAWWLRPRWYRALPSPGFRERSAEKSRTASACAPRLARHRPRQ